MVVLGNRVYITPEYESKEVSGIILELESSGKKMTNTGLVSYVGNKVKDIKQGDRVMFDKVAARKITVQGEDFVVLDCSNIIGILIEED